MKRLTREERRRIQRRAANIRFLAFVLILLALGVCIGYTAAHAQDACEPPELQEVSQPSPVDDMPQEPAEQPAEDYSSLDRLELIGTFTATAYCPCVKCCGIWSEDHPSRGEDYVQKTRAGTIPEEGRTIAADWDVLPKGSEVVINGHPYIVEDTGSAVKGNHVDIFFESHEAPSSSLLPGGCPSLILLSCRAAPLKFAAGRPAEGWNPYHAGKEAKPMDERQEKSILEMGRGAIMERADYEMRAMIRNILDPNTSAKAARKLNITLTFKPGDDRQTIVVECVAKSTLASTNAITTMLYVLDEDTVVEMAPQIPGQLAVDAGEQEAPPKLRLIHSA